MRLCIVASHPIQYHAPLFRALASRCQLAVYFAHQQSREGQADAGYGVAFDWDVDLLGGYTHQFLQNDAAQPGVDRFLGCRSAELKTLLTAERFDAVVVMGWNLWVYWQAVHLCRQRGIAVLARTDSHLGSPRSFWRRSLKEILYPRLLRRLDGFFAVGARSREYLLHYGVSTESIWAAKHVVDTQRFADESQITVTQRAALKRELGLLDDAKLVLFVGRLLAWKRVHDVIAALALIPKLERPQFLIVGDGSERVRLQQLAERVAVDCRFAGFKNQQELPKMYALADVLVLASEGEETWGLVVNEAMACGVPAVVSDAVGCGDDLIPDERSGGKFVLGETSSLAAALMRVLQKDRSEYTERLAEITNLYSPQQSAADLVRGVAHCVAKKKSMEHTGS